MKCRVIAFVGQMKPRSQGHWASWMILVRGREERLRVRSQYRRWLWTWWNYIYTGLSKEGLHIWRLLPWPNLKLSSLMNPHQIRNRWHCNRCYGGLIDCGFLLQFYMLFYLFWVNILVGIYWCWEGFDGARNANGQINLWRCWFW